MGFLQGLYEDTVAPGRDGQYRGTGLGAFILKPFVDEDEIESGMQQEAVRQVIVGAGEDPAQYDLGGNATTTDARGAVATTIRDRDAKKGETDFNRNLTATMAPINAGIQAQGQQLQAQLQQSSQQFAQTAQDSRNQFQIQMEQLRNDRADAKEQQALDLEYRRMQDRKEDLRYNENLERMDRKDRQASINTLVQGLAALGAAFAA